MFRHSLPKRPTTRQLQFEGLEGRQLMATGVLATHAATALVDVPEPAAFVSPISRAATAAAPAQGAALTANVSLGQKMADFLQNKLGARVGGGECAHVATEALRASGADFTRTEPKTTTDYVWTTNRVARLTNGSQLAGKRFEVGDIVQYENATFSSGGSSKLRHHTQVVAAVDAKGRITKVFEQNVGGNRTVQKDTATDLTKLTGGSVSIYRPVARTTQTGLLEYTIVNNTSASRTYVTKIGSSTSNTTLDKRDTEGSYRASFVKFSGKVTPTLTIGSSSVTIQNGAAYELYTNASGQVAIRRLGLGLEFGWAL